MGLDLLSGAALSNRKELFPKGIHPNEAGAGLIEETVFNTISNRG